MEGWKEGVEGWRGWRGWRGGEGGGVGQDNLPKHISSLSTAPSLSPSSSSHRQRSSLTTIAVTCCPGTRAIARVALSIPPPYHSPGVVTRHPLCSPRLQ